LCKEFREYHSIDVSFLEENVRPDIAGEVGLCLFRIAQEALQNIQKHSGANSAEIRLETVGEKIHLSISDDGSGFDPMAAPKGEGIGIRSMEERVRLVKGEFVIGARPMEGTRIDVWVPLAS
jgi:signal transduction histidine kinase